ncbi:STAS domain-containing protein [Mycobacterium paraterrae]|uniref:STAS domain-containing protein n=1 Tax=Mycobacterium paraterrae TaxID=577492 RepID=A0ABY3VGB1_9MYCO|nr:STAS domain-containing protein [Mycobacterium paraterrae]UMB68454.1 STAS domain-containing protein [Mycobacterium paraterrae]
MSAVFTTTAAPVRGADAAFPPPAWENHSARFSARWEDGRVIVTAQGELDASNATQFADYFDLCISDSTPLVVDLSGLEFFGTAGFSALHLINVRCAGANLRWAVVPSKAVSRLLRICDPAHALPMSTSVHAMPDVDNDDPDQNQLFQLVP